MLLRRKHASPAPRRNYEILSDFYKKHTGKAMSGKLSNLYTWMVRTLNGVSYVAMMPPGTPKAALDALVRTYAGETAKTSVKANLFSPGPVRTAMRARAMPGENPLSVPHPDEVAPSIVALASPQCVESGKLFDFVQNRFLDFNPPD